MKGAFLDKKSKLASGLSILAIFGLVAGIVLATGTTDLVSASVTINSYCSFTVSNTAIDFGSLFPGNTIPTDNVITVSDTGNIGSNILTSGSNWAFASNTFGVTNTVWSPTSGTTYASATPLTGTTTDTKIVVTTTTSNDIYYGLGIPAGEAPGTYSQTINVISSC